MAKPDRQASAAKLNLVPPLEAPMAEKIPVITLRGGPLGKSIVIPEGEEGVVMEASQVVEVLPPGKHGVGKNKDRWVMRIRKDEYSLLIEVTSLIAGDYEPVDAHMTASVSLDDASTFARSLAPMLGRPESSRRIYAGTLAAAVSSTLEVPLGAKVYDYPAEALCQKSEVADRISREVRPMVESALNERGMLLNGFSFAAFRPSSEMDEIVEFAEVFGNMATGGSDDLQRAATLLPGMVARGFVGESEGEGLNRRLEEAQAGGQGNTETVIAELRQAMSGLEGRLESSLNQRLEQLAIKVGDSVQPAEQEGEDGSLLDRWVDGGALLTDQAIRRQAGLELSSAVESLKDAKLASYRHDNKALADVIGELENSVDMYKSQLEGAAFGSYLPDTKKSARLSRIAGIIKFEEDVLRTARAFSSKSLTIKQSSQTRSLLESTVWDLSNELDTMKRGLIDRAGMFQGIQR